MSHCLNVNAMKQKYIIDLLDFFKDGDNRYTTKSSLFHVLFFFYDFSHIIVIISCYYHYLFNNYVSQLRFMFNWQIGCNGCVLYFSCVYLYKGIFLLIFFLIQFSSWTIHKLMIGLFFRM